MGKKRIVGIDRAFMLLCKQARRYWEFYSPAYEQTKTDSHCNGCGKRVRYVEVDHEPPLGSRPHFDPADPQKSFLALADYLFRMFMGPVQGMCEMHHDTKTATEREKRKKRKAA